MKNKKGITLIALVVTIIVLIILAGVSISLVLGDNGIISRSQLAKKEYANAETYEKEQMEDVLNEMEVIVGSNRDTNGDKVTLIWEGTGNLGDTITLLNNHQFSEFDMVCFYYNRSDNQTMTQSELLVKKINDIIEGKIAYHQISGYSDYHMCLNQFTNSSFKIHSQNNYVLKEVYGIKY